jgi:hypothetical protein
MTTRFIELGAPLRFSAIAFVERDDRSHCIEQSKSLFGKSHEVADLTITTTRQVSFEPGGDPEDAETFTRIS